MRRKLSWIVVVVVCAIGFGAAQTTLPEANAGQAGRVTSDYTLLRAKPHGFVIGTAYRGQVIVAQQEALEGYQWARIGNNFDDCAWIAQNAVNTTAPSRDFCRHSGREISETRFARFIALGGDTVRNPRNGTDGLRAHIDVNQSGCTLKHAGHTFAFGNVDAIEGGSATPKDYRFPVAQGHSVLWRYLTRDFRWFLVRDPSRGSTDGTGASPWYYLQARCVVPDQVHPHRYVP